MSANKGPFNTNILLWWVAIISLAVSGTLYYLLGTQAEFDVHMREKRVLIPLFGVIIAGVCLIAGTAGRWFYPK